jgi:type II secretory pathway pseudopilin PulG
VAVVGILAVVIVPNISSFLRTGRVHAANVEVQTIKMATQNYAADNQLDWPVD